MSDSELETLKVAFAQMKADYIAQIEALEAEVTHWRANHDSQLGRKREVQRLYEELRVRVKASSEDA